MTGRWGEKCIWFWVGIDFYISIKIDTESYFLYFATHDLLCHGDGAVLENPAQQEQQKSNFVRTVYVLAGG